MTTAGLEAELPARARSGAGTILLNGGVFLAACICTCLGISSFQPFPDVPTIGPKFRYYAAHREDYDVVFVGSSRFYHQIIPAQFDAAVAAAGGPKVRSFNLACDALWPPESYYFLRKILALHSSRLRWVVIEMMDINPMIDEANKDSLREAYWHDWRHTRLAWEALDLPPQLLDKDKRDLLEAHPWLGLIQSQERRAAAMKGELALMHGGFLLNQWVNYSRGADWLENTLDYNPSSDKSDQWLPFAGYKAEPEGGIPAADVPEYRAAVERIIRNLPRPATPSPVLQAALEKVIAETRAAGPEPIFVTTPTLNHLENFGGAPSDAPLFRFTDPLKYPVLFDPARHFDGWHLNHQGALKFTDFLAHEFTLHRQPVPSGTPPAMP
jgi:hypothetical protein